MIPILYQDDRLVVCLKPTGISSEDDGLPALLSVQLDADKLYCVHRLDKGVGGVMVYARDRQSAAALSSIIASLGMENEYLAVIPGTPPEDAGELTDLLFHDRSKNKTYVVKRMRAGVKEAKLSYRLLESQGPLSLLRVRLHTGRSHQIRVQFASRKLPLLGDRKYGSTVACPSLALWACSLSFPHPGTGERLSFTALPEMSFPWDQFTILTQEA